MGKLHWPSKNTEKDIMILLKRLLRHPDRWMKQHFARRTEITTHVMNECTGLEEQVWSRLCNSFSTNLVHELVSDSLYEKRSKQKPTGKNYRKMNTQWATTWKLLAIHSIGLIIFMIIKIVLILDTSPAFNNTLEQSAFNS